MRLAKGNLVLAGIASLLGSGCQLMPDPPFEADYVAGSLIQFTGEAANPNGAWCWFQDERVIVNTHSANDPVLMFTAISASTSDEEEQGDLDLYWYGLNSKQGGVVELHDRLGQDDHNVAALFQLPNGQTLAAYARHNKDTNTYSRLSVQDNPAVWSEASLYEGEAKSTYNNLLTAGVGDEKELLNFSRLQGWDPNFLIYDEDRGSWTYGGRLLASEGRPYLNYAGSADGTKIHVVATDQHPRNFDNSIYHGVMDGNALFDSKGKVLDRDLSDQDAVEPTALTVVFQGDPDNVAWMADVEIDDNDQPVIAFSVQKDGRGLPQGSGGLDHRYHLARLGPDGWQQYEIAYAGERLYPREDDYTGLVAIDPDDVNHLVISSNADPDSGAPLISSADQQRHYEIFEGKSSDGGKTFTWQALTRNSTVDNIRPIIPAWESDQRVVLWMRGSYTTYTDFDTHIVGVIQTRSATPSNKVLIVHDELPQMEVLADFLRAEGGLDVTVVEQSALPEDWSAYQVVIAYIHRVLEVPTEKAIISYTENGGRYIALHHSISSKKADNEFYFDFLGVQLDNPKAAKNPVMPGGGYGWRDETLTLVNLNPAHYITSHNVTWGEEVAYTPSDQPSVEGMYPSLALHESEVYMNHKFTDGRQKTVLMGFRFLDDRNGQMFMQDRAGWVKKYGNGEVIYLMPEHAATDFENDSFVQMILNAITWKP